jgi:hypothetical protein
MGTFFANYVAYITITMVIRTVVGFAIKKGGNKIATLTSNAEHKTKKA